MLPPPNKLHLSNDKSPMQGLFFIRTIIIFAHADLPSPPKLTHYKKDYYLYKSIPGIGGITAAGILSKLGDIRRFKRLDELAAIVGLVQGIYHSPLSCLSSGLWPCGTRLRRFTDRLSNILLVRLYYKILLNYVYNQSAHVNDWA
jgi:Transposase IS116/IS110/IS902 family